ncbi:MAG: FtsX-like permease family protein [Myxococcales bacterium]|nr:FtsX-like permease family protein [Myxococcales bacterium]MCB9731382.1 FtsX-like permease family protein [Deltaproteobacteria bacterium]
MGRVLLIAFRNVMSSRLRTLLLGGAIAFVTMLLVFMMGLSGGVQETILRSATTLSTGDVNVSGYYKTSPSSARPVVTDVAAVEAVVRETLPEATHMVRRLSGDFDRVISASGSLQNALIGVEANEEKKFREVLSILEGDLADLAEPGTALIFKRQAEELEVKVGDALVLTGTTARGVHNTADVRVVAIADDMGILSAFETFVDAGTVRKLYQLKEGTGGTLMIYLPDRKDAPAAAEKLRAALEAKDYALMTPEAKPFWQKKSTVEREDWTGQRLDVTTWRDEVANLLPIVDGLDVVSALLVFILMGIILAGIIIALSMSIRRRTQEIGTLRAIGMGRGSVLWMVVFEAAILALIGATVGAVLGAVVVGALSGHVEPPNEAVKIFLLSDTLVLKVQAAALVRAVFTIAVVTSIAALLPAMKATRIQPVAAMQSANG